MIHPLVISRLIIGLVVFSLCFSTFVFAAPAMPPGTLTAKELQGQFYNKTVEVAFVKGKNKAIIYFSPNGELKKIVNNRMYQGNWKVHNNGRLCTKIGSDNWDCRAVVKMADGFQQYVVKKDGKHRHELTYKKFHPGKALNKLNRSPLLPTGTLYTKQLRKLFSNKTVESVTAKKHRVSRTYYAPDGGVVQLRNGIKRTGKWRVKNSRICLQMENMQEKCRIIVKENGSYRKYIVKKNGQHQHSVSYRDFVSGDRLR